MNPVVVRLIFLTLFRLLHDLLFVPWLRLRLRDVEELPSRWLILILSLDFETIASTKPYAVEWLSRLILLTFSAELDTSARPALTRARTDPLVGLFSLKTSAISRKQVEKPGIPLSQSSVLSLL